MHRWHEIILLQSACCLQEREVSLRHRRPVNFIEEIAAAVKNLALRLAHRAFFRERAVLEISTDVLVSAERCGGDRAVLI